ncbi:hypothetical protein LHYA1_G008996 [Lachnellula hyalina]|uniref:Uncharacterized protein n=1 Tax=Lachnellula hyalina TaxID=1316788 RepID=A0A8H8QSX7_9HELO|nr:uncharacterized protein LHYA1_G008996 [Lachnellula hyalina]TVY22193.1 hypothetical protein LHYA1_G008996 [Lachnellula hyalina]
MLKPGRTQRLLSFTLKPLLLALFVSLIFHWTSRPSSPSFKKPINPHPHLSKALVIASTTSSNLTWLTPALQSSHWTPHIYTTDSPSAELTVPVNKGNEAMVYLTYIIDNYDTLPDIIFFHHDHAQTWHQQFSSAYELAHLNPLSVQKHGYLSPRCLPGCENVIQLSGDVAPLHDLKGSPRDVQISSVLREFWSEDGELPEKIAAPCCAQFAVTREAVRRRGVETWRALREWLVKTDLDSRSSGRVLEYTWHLWFGMEAVHCPAEEQCLCDVFGVGNCS